MATLISSEFLINTTTDFIEAGPQVAIDGQGNFVVVWASENLADLLEQGIFFRRFDNTADDIDNADIAVDTTTQNDRLSDPTVAMADDGRFVIVWEDDDDAGEGTELRIAAQLYEADGDADGSEFSITSDLTSSNFSPDVAINQTTGDFVVTWLEVDDNDGDRSILARRFDSDGEALDNEDIVVETLEADDFAEGQSIDDPAIATDSSGNFIITWEQNLNDSNSDNGRDIYARLYDSSSNAVTNAFIVNNEQEQSQFQPDIAADAEGNFTIVWESVAIDDIDRNRGIFARRFSDSGTALDVEFAVSAPDPTDRFETNPAIGIDNLGNTLITWTSVEVDGNTGFDIFAQQYDQNGTAVGSSFQVNADDQEDGNQARSAVAIGPDGKAVVVFQGDLQSTNAQVGDQDIFGQQVDLTGDPVTPVVSTPSTEEEESSPGINLVGSQQRDVLKGDGEDNTIDGGGGNDVIEGRGGNDTLIGGTGNDKLSGNAGDDRLFGGDGRDDLSGNNGNDQISGGDRRDEIKGGGGDDEMDGDAGNDIIRGGKDNDFLRGGDGSDRLIGGKGDDRLNGGAGDDVLTGNAGVNILNGGGGQNLLIGSNNGEDTFVLFENNGFAIIRGFIERQDLLGFASLGRAFSADYEYNGAGSLVIVNGQQVAFVEGADLSVNATQRGIVTTVTQAEAFAIPDPSN
ncbi:MAG: calcium-binding protein [Leptolyngbyaceae cyanobacterium]